MAYSVIVNYEWEVMNLFARVIYPADLWSPWSQTYPSVCTDSLLGLVFTLKTGLRLLL